MDRKASSQNSAAVARRFASRDSDPESTQHVSASDFIGIQPGVGDSTNRYFGLDDGNADLFKADNSGRTDAGDAPDIYMGVSGNLDLQF